MPISVLEPQPFVGLDDFDYDAEGDVDMEDGGVKLDLDIDKPKRLNLDGGAAGQIVTPGEIVTEDPQWMRGHGTYLSTATPTSQTIISSLAGTIHKTNKLLSIHPLRTRYTPEIGDLVVGRILEVSTKRWSVDISAPHSAVLLLSSINLPGGILRKRTTTDELQIRTFFSEGDLLVAEVQQLYQEGAASLHTRSLKYGKLRNGVFVSVGPGRVRRMKSHVQTITTSHGSDLVDCVFGVNGYIWLSKHIAPITTDPTTGSGRTTELEEAASEAIYSSVNDEISVETRREIARLGWVIRAMCRWNLKIDENVQIVYDVAVEMEGEQGVEESWAQGGPEGEAGRRLVEDALMRIRMQN